MATRPGADSASPVARLTATVVFPAPPFGETTVMTRPRGVSSSRFWAAMLLLTWRRAAAAPARLNDSRTWSSSAPTEMISRTPARSARSQSRAVGLATRTTQISGNSRSNDSASARAVCGANPGPRTTTPGSP